MRQWGEQGEAPFRIKYLMAGRRGLEGLRWHASQRRCIAGSKVPAYTRRKYTGGVPNNRILRYHMGNRTVAEADGFEVILTLTADDSAKFGILRLKLLDKSQMPRFVIQPVKSAMPCVFTNTLIVRSARTSRLQVLGADVFHRE